MWIRRTRRGAEALALAGAVLACGGETAPPPPPSVAAIAVVSGGGQATDPGAVFPEPVTVKVTDAAGAGIPGAGVRFTVTAGMATLAVPAATTDGQGLARTGVTAGSTSGPVSLQASAGTPPRTTTATLTVQVTVAPGLWDGSTMQGLPVHLRIGGTRMIDSLAVRLMADYGASSCTGTVIKRAIPIRDDGGFETTLGIGFQARFHGQFTSPTTVSGALESFFGAYAALCGNTVIMGAGTTIGRSTWEARGRP